MSKQVKMYCVRLNLVRTTRERYLGNLRYDINQRKYNFRKGLSLYVKSKLDVKNWTEDCSKLFREIINRSKRYAQIEKELKIIQKEISNLYELNKNLDRNVKSKKIKTKDIIAIGENNLVRTLGLDLGTFTDKIITVKVGDMDDKIVRKIINSGLTIDDKKYIFFTAGAGQTRTKKFMMILDDERLQDTLLSLMCGLTIEEINKRGGMNISKFLAYLALNNSGSTVWEDFDINKCIVVEDFETFISAEVDYIDRQVSKEKLFDKNGRPYPKKVAEWNINREKRNDIVIPHFDGLGLILDKNYTRNIQVRLPWVKGLLTYFNVVEYCKEKGYSTKVIDIDNKEWDIVDDDIKVIFTRSQFKLHSVYKSWKEYCDNFTKYNCTANICMKDSNKITDYKDMETNYQVLQQLIHMTDKQIDVLTTDFCKLIKQVHTDRESQLKFLGAISTNNNRNYFQEALRLYPEMLKNAYVKKQISDKITSEKKKACSGKIELKNSKRVFILSDPTAFCDWLFGKIENPEGVLKDGEVYCNLYKNEKKLDVLRSPSLSFEHVIRNNTRVNGKNKWFNTNGLYTSVYDIISKILAFDVDGDEALIITTDWIISLAEEMVRKYDIKPIYFKMGKAGAKEINNNNIAESLLFVYHKSNIGKVSNKLTQIWNSDNPMKKYKIMQKLCAYNNDVIDSAKTLDIPKLPEDINDILKNKKNPYFFKYVKDEKDAQCKKMSNSVMDRLCKKIETIEYTNFDYKKGFGTFRIKPLKHNQGEIKINQDVIKTYKSLECITLAKINSYANNMNDDEDKKKSGFKEMFYNEAKKIFLEYVDTNKLDYVDCVDMIVEYIYKVNDSKMAFMWNVFGDVIINNLKNNIKKPIDNNYILCDECGKRVKRESNNQKRCTSCSKKRNVKKILKK